MRLPYSIHFRQLTIFSRRQPGTISSNVHTNLSGLNRVVLFDAKADQGVAREVPPEAYRRFCSDQRARIDRGKNIFARESAVHDEKERLIAEWVSSYGT